MAGFWKRAVVVLALVGACAALLAAEASATAFQRSPHPPAGSPVGVVLIFPSNGWRERTVAQADADDGEWIDALNRQGFQVVNLAFNGGGHILRRGLNVYDKVRSRFPSLPLCVGGQSSGAQLALMVSARRDDLDCVLDVSGPPDLARWGGRPKSKAARRLAIEAFGRERLSALSPIHHVADLDEPIFLAAAKCDVFIAPRHQIALADGVVAAGGEVVWHLFEEGEPASYWPHCPVTQESWDTYRTAEAKFLSRVLTAPPAFSPESP